MPEAPLADSGSGLAPSGAGWFVVNVRDAEWWTSQTFGSGCAFESRDAFFSEFGINVSVLEPGSANCLYHSESQQEAFLVLSGECKLLVDGEERPLSAWDFVHCPAGTEHVFVGAGEAPCVVLMVGARSRGREAPLPRVGAGGGLRCERGRGDGGRESRRTRASSGRCVRGRRTGISCPGRRGRLSGPERRQPWGFRVPSCSSFLNPPLKLLV